MRKLKPEYRKLANPKGYWPIGITSPEDSAMTGMLAS